MATQDRTPYQEKIIKRYYENRKDIMSQKLEDLVSDLYLSEGKKRKQIWKRVSVALSNLGVSQVQIDYLVSSDNPAGLVRYIEKRR
ncbi:MAG: hypothetical protein LBQ66_02955 [Planctomycetaceae bacterium]|jgi:hypothetical protein|nr:hypothetical protein [Planctomycetaceae bacterium]